MSGWMDGWLGWEWPSKHTTDHRRTQDCRNGKGEEDGKDEEEEVWTRNAGKSAGVTERKQHKRAPLPAPVSKARPASYSGRSTSSNK